MRTFSVSSDKFVFSAIFMILFASTLWISSVSALPQQTSLRVKIINPAKGQQLAIDSYGKSSRHHRGGGGDGGGYVGGDGGGYGGGDGYPWFFGG